MSAALADRDPVARAWRAAWAEVGWAWDDEARHLDALVEVAAACGPDELWPLSSRVAQASLDAAGRGEHEHSVALLRQLDRVCAAVERLDHALQPATGASPLRDWARGYLSEWRELAYSWQRVFDDAAQRRARGAPLCDDACDAVVVALGLEAVVHEVREALRECGAGDLARPVVERAAERALDDEIERLKSHAVDDYEADLDDDPNVIDWERE